MSTGADHAPPTDMIAQRVRDVAESATLAIDATAKELRVAGEDVISFGAGEPDFPTPAHIVEAAREACVQPWAHRYSPTPGIPALREAIARKTERDSGLVTGPDQVIVTNGGKQALYTLFQTLLDPGDKVLVPAPYWVSYPEQVRLAGGIPTIVPTTAGKGFRVSVEQLEAARTPATKALVFVSPSNPTGAVYPPEEIEAIGRWAAHVGLWVITDEIYEHLVYGDARHVSMPTVVPALRERCIVVNGVAKTYAMTGWRVGWAIAPAGFVSAMGRLQSHVCSNVSNVAQAAALAAVAGPLDCLAEMRETYDRRRKLTYQRLSEIDGVRCPVPEGAFYAFPSFEGVFGRTIGGTRIASDQDLCAALLSTARIALVPGSGFGAPGCARISYVLADNDLARGLDRLVDALH
ncbi:MAG: pyridoxal phosphate-dependent aminotransferase [Egibacteraceae bacterium]